MDPDGNLAWYESLSGRGIRPGLDNINELLRLIGNPQQGLRCIHVAGTDGKGSVCAMVESILKESGLSVGCFTSPHVIEVNECIRLDGNDISRGDLLHQLSLIRPYVESLASKGVECTAYEVLTAIALQYFSSVEVDFAVIEVGMGGRLDCTNVVEPVVTIINNISLEHTAFLGDTIEKIAWEKAGIMKPGVPCVTMNDDASFDVIQQRASAIGCPLLRIYSDSVNVVDSKPDSIDMVFRDEIYTVSVPGRHQARNAALAIAAVSMLDEYHDVIEDHVRDGLESVNWLCRMQKLMAMPMIVDVTHTVSGAECLAKDIFEIYGEVVLVLGMLSDKDLEGVCRAIAPVARTVVITAPDSPRAADPTELALLMGGYHNNVLVRSDLERAIELAMEVRDDMNILVTGSFRMAEGVLRWIQRRSA